MSDSRKGNIPGYVWLGLLAVALFFSAQRAWRETSQVKEYAIGCDSFGYLQMAQEIRLASAQQRRADFHMVTPHTRALIETLTAEGFPLADWMLAVAPHAHLYFAPADAIGPQYPPGTGLLLSLFPPDYAVQGLNRAVIGFLLALGWALLGLAAWRRAWWSAGLLALTAYFGMMILARVGYTSFSINALIVPLTVSVLLSCRATVGGRKEEIPRWSYSLALLSGLLFGFCVLIRLPALLLLPGLCLLYAHWPLERRAILRALALLAGMAAGGAIPLAFHQQRVTGAWYMSTYSRLHDVPASWASLAENWHYYFGGGSGSLDNWGLFWALPGVVGCALLLTARGREKGRVLAAGFVMWLIPCAYFMRHVVNAQYYMAPSLLGAVALLAGAFFLLEARPAEAVLRFGPLRALLLVLTLLPGLAVCRDAWQTRAALADNKPPAAPGALEAPEELMDARAWIWSDELSGSFWYYAQRPAFKLDFATAPVRERIFRLAFERNEPQYVVADNSAMYEVMAQIRSLGGQLEQRGTVGGFQYFRVRWDSVGPRETD